MDRTQRHHQTEAWRDPSPLAQRLLEAVVLRCPRPPDTFEAYPGPGSASLISMLMGAGVFAFWEVRRRRVRSPSRREQSWTL